jgi:hypothetical protein
VKLNKVLHQDAEPSNNLANSLFGTFLDVDYRESQPKFVCYYAGKPSEHLDMRENADYRWRSDAFDLSRSSDNPLATGQIYSTKTDWAQSNKLLVLMLILEQEIKVFFIVYNLTKTLPLPQLKVTELLRIWVTKLVVEEQSTQNVSLYNLYKNRSYECRVESMGNAMIQPTMYFNLRNVPMFRGPYMIQDVEHTIRCW